jgi:hypothetical protein
MCPKTFSQHSNNGTPILQQRTALCLGLSPAAIGTVVTPKEGQMRFTGQASRSTKFAIFWAADSRHKLLLDLERYRRKLALRVTGLPLGILPYSIRRCGAKRATTAIRMRRKHVCHCASHETGILFALFMSDLAASFDNQLQDELANEC